MNFPNNLSCSKCGKILSKRTFNHNEGFCDTCFSERFEEENFEIFFQDLTPKAQKELLKWANIKDPKENNWDTLPITLL